jgi:hypothetical protein
MVVRSHIVDCYSFEGSGVVPADHIGCLHSQVAMALVAKEVGCLALTGLGVGAVV